MSALESKKCNVCGTTYDDSLYYCLNDGAPLVPADPLIGSLLDGRYRIDSFLGRGGMGAVYRATHIHIDTEFAIKVLHPDLVANQSAIERFRREAKAAGRIHHPNAIQVTDFGVTAERVVYLVMELVDGYSLRRVLEEEKCLDYYRAITIIQQTCAAVEVAHQKGIIHRDLKPDNIMIKREDDVEKVKVLDFGIAKLREQVPSSGSSETLTREGTIIGTPEYMSPEQCRGKKLDPRSDIYSLGVILYEMICGHPPFTAESPLEVVVKHLSAKMRPLCEMCAEVPRPVERVVMHALEKDPDKRPASAEILSQELQAAVEAAQSGYITGTLTSRSTAEPFPGALDTESDQEGLTEAETLIDSVVEPLPRSPSRATPKPSAQRPRPSSSTNRKAALTPAGARPRALSSEGKLQEQADGDLESSDSIQATDEAVPFIPESAPAEDTFIGKLIKSRMLVMAIAAVLIVGLGLGAYFYFRPAQPPTDNKEKPSAIPAADMALIQGGTFVMGREDGEEDERPSHRVQVKDFYLDIYEVTNEQYKKFVDTAPHPPPSNWTSGAYPVGEAKLPVTHVTWQNAGDYAKWAGKRLPTEEEWEYAARNGSKQTLYPWGNKWKENLAAVRFLDRVKPFPVGSFINDQNEFGIYDLGGNVSEWVQDSYHSYDGKSVDDSLKIFRGGNFAEKAVPAEKITSTYRWYLDATPDPGHLAKIGFRCAKDAK